MRIGHIRIIHLLLLLHSLFFGNFIWMYVLIWHIILEVINTSGRYKSQTAWKTYNALFISYITYITISRNVSGLLTREVAEIANRIEHVGFVITLGLLLYVLLRFRPYDDLDERSRIGAAFLLVNFIGVANEVFQAWYGGWKMPISFLTDSVNDVMTNAVASFVCSSRLSYFPAI